MKSWSLSNNNRSQRIDLRPEQATFHMLSIDSFTVLQNRPTICQDCFYFPGWILETLGITHKSHWPFGVPHIRRHEVETLGNPACWNTFFTISFSIVHIALYPVLSYITDSFWTSYAWIQYRQLVNMETIRASNVVGVLMSLKRDFLVLQSLSIRAWINFSEFTSVMGTVSSRIERPNSFAIQQFFLAYRLVPKMRALPHKPAASPTI